MGYPAREVLRSNTCTRKKYGFHKTGRRKSFVPQKVRPRSLTTLPEQLSNKQRNSRNANVENERQG